MREAAIVFFQKPVFDPKTSDHIFRIVSEDYFSAVLIPPLLDRLRAAALRVRIEVGRTPDDPISALRNDESDLLIGVFDRDARTKRRVLFRERNVCIVREDHPKIKSRLSLERYAETPHVLVSVGARAPTVVDRQLAEHSLQRSVGLRVDNFLTAPIAVASSDMLFTCPQRLAGTYSPWTS